MNDDEIRQALNPQDERGEPRALELLAIECAKEIEKRGRNHNKRYARRSGNLYIEVAERSTRSLGPRVAYRVSEHHPWRTSL